MSESESEPKEERDEVAPEQLPPLEDIVIPKTVTKSAMIRWMTAMGYKVVDIHHYTGIPYQMVRNIAKSAPKRAAREDLPPLVVVYKEEQDIIDAAMDGALEASLLEGRKARKKAEAADRRALKAGVDLGESDDEEELGQDE